MPGALHRPCPPADPNSVTYVVQMQVLGTTQWLVLAAGVRDTTYTVHGLTKGAQYLFRVITATPKTNSKPCPPVGPVQLLDRGERGSGEGMGGWGGGVSVLCGVVSCPGLGDVGSGGGGDDACGRSLPGRGPGHPGQARCGVRGGGSASLHHHHHQPCGGHCHLEEVGHGAVPVACPMPSIAPQGTQRGAPAPAPRGACGGWGSFLGAELGMHPRFMSRALQSCMRGVLFFGGGGAVSGVLRVGSQSGGRANNAVRAVCGGCGVGAGARAVCGSGGGHGAVRWELSMGWWVWGCLWGRDAAAGVPAGAGRCWGSRKARARW